MTRSRPLPPRLQNRLYALLAELTDVQHQPQKLVANRPLWSGSRKLLFYYLGYIAKADGRVTEDDIRFAEALMNGLELRGKARRVAIARFHQGRDSRQPSGVRASGLRLLQPFRLDSALLIALCLCHGAQIRGRPGKPRRYRCEDALVQLGLPLEVMDEVLDSYAREAWFDSLTPQPRTYQEACRLLKVSSGDDFETIKRAYRREVSRVHPDKLSKDLTRAQLTQARDHLVRLQQAWEVVRQHQRASR